MPTLRPKMSELAKGLTLATGDRYKIIIPLLTVDVVETEDIHFHFDSAVVLPWRYYVAFLEFTREQRVIATVRAAHPSAGQWVGRAGVRGVTLEADRLREPGKTVPWRRRYAPSRSHFA